MLLRPSSKRDGIKVQTTSQTTKQKKKKKKKKKNPHTNPNQINVPWPS
jgi:hypothetical protein